MESKPLEHSNRLERETLFVSLGQELDIAKRIFGEAMSSLISPQNKSIRFVLFERIENAVKDIIGRLSLAFKEAGSEEELRTLIGLLIITARSDTSIEYLAEVGRSGPETFLPLVMQKLFQVDQTLAHRILVDRLSRETSEVAVQILLNSAIIFGQSISSTLAATLAKRFLSWGSNQALMTVKKTDG
jgi:hypothetical protein